jgi:hypothetical protein
MRWTLPELWAVPVSYYETLVTMLHEEERTPSP